MQLECIFSQAGNLLSDIAMAKIWLYLFVLRKNFCIFIFFTSILLSFDNLCLVDSTCLCWHQMVHIDRCWHQMVHIDRCWRAAGCMQLLDFEPRAAEQVPLLMKLKKNKHALKKAVDSGDADLGTSPQYLSFPKQNQAILEVYWCSCKVLDYCLQWTGALCLQCIWCCCS